MSESKFSLKTGFALVAMLSIGGVIGWLLNSTPPLNDRNGFRLSPPELANVFVSWDIPEQAVAGENYRIDLNLQELQGSDRIVTTMSIEGFMLTRALGSVGTKPESLRGTSNTGDGWINQLFQLPLGPFQKKTISLYANSTKAGPAYGEIVIGFQNNQSVRIPIYFEITD